MNLEKIKQIWKKFLKYSIMKIANYGKLNLIIIHDLIKVSATDFNPDFCIYVTRETDGYTRAVANSCCKILTEANVVCLKILANDDSLQKKQNIGDTQLKESFPKEKRKQKMTPRKVW